MKRRVLRHEVVQPLDQSIRLIPLTQGKDAIVDAGDYDWLLSFTWRAQRNSGGSYEGYYAISTEAGLMHRAIMAKFTDIVGILVDHKDCDGLNNSRLNLRCATRAQNRQNVRLYCNNALGVKGVRFVPNRNYSYRAQITVNGRKIYLGHFRTELEASLAYQRAAMFHFGEFFRAE